MDPRDVALDASFYREKSRYLYNVAIRVLWNPQDAEDAVQDILLKIHQGVPSFRGECALDTWIHRVAIHHLINLKKKRFRDEGLTFEQFRSDIDQTDEEAASPFSDPVEEREALQEVQIGCTLALLQCLDVSHRIVFVLGTMFELSSDEGAAALEIAPAAYRKRLSRARSKVRSFLTSSCGLVRRDARCHCRRRLAAAIQKGRVRPNQWLFVPAGERITIAECLDSMNRIDEIASLYRSGPYYRLTKPLEDTVASLLEGEAPIILRVP